MGIHKIGASLPRSIQLGSSSASFTSCRVLGQKFAFDPRQHIMDPGTHQAPNLHLLGTAERGDFFRSKGIDRTNWVVGLYNGEIGRLTGPVTWVGISKTASFVADHIYNTRFIKELIDCLPENIAKTEIIGRDVVMTHITDRRLIPLNREGVAPSPAMSALIAQLDSIDLRAMDHVTLEDNGGTLRVHWRRPGMEPRDLDVRHLNLGKRRMFDDPRYPEFHVRLVCPDVIEDIEVTGRDQRNKDITSFRPRYFIEYHVCSRTRFTDVIPQEYAGMFDHAAAIKVRSGLKVRHLTSANGMPSGTEEIIPYGHRLPHFPNMEYYNPDPHQPFGTKFTESGTETVLGPQHLVPKWPHVEDQDRPAEERHDFQTTRRPIDDQLFFFAERVGSTVAYQKGLMFMDREEQPWWFRLLQGTHGLFRTKVMAGVDTHFLSGKKVREDSAKTQGAGMSAGPHTITANPVMHHALYDEEKVGRPGLWRTTIPEILTIIEDAQGSYCSYVWQGSRTVPMNLIVGFGSGIDHPAQFPGQRARWNGGLERWLNSLSKLFKKDLLRASSLGKAISFFWRNADFYIPKTFKLGQVWEWGNVGSWYYDATIKLGIPLIALSFVFFGITPLTVAAAVSLPAMFLAMTLTAWPSYAFQAAKVGINPKDTFSLNPANIFWWLTACPEVHRSNMNIEDVSYGPFRSFDTSYGKRISPESKRKLFWLGTVAPIAAGAALMGITAYAMVGLGLSFGIVAAPLVAGIIASSLISRGLNRVKALENPGTKRFLPSFIKFAGYTAPLAAGLATSIALLSASAPVAIPLIAAVSIGFWSLFAGLNVMNVWRNYFKEQENLFKVNSITVPIRGRMFNNISPTLNGAGILNALTASGHVNADGNLNTDFFRHRNRPPIAGLSAEENRKVYDKLEGALVEKGPDTALNAIRDIFNIKAYFRDQ